MSDLDIARDAICKAIERQAEEADVSQIVELADAYSRLSHGPQGGAMRYEYNGDITNRYAPDQPRGAGFTKP